MDIAIRELDYKLIKRKYLEVIESDFEYIVDQVKENKMAAFNFCPNKWREFGVVLTLIEPKSKLTATFSGLHPGLNTFLFVAIKGLGGFGFGFDHEEERKKFHISYVCEKLGLSEGDGEGFCELLDHVHNGILHH